MTVCAIACRGVTAHCWTSPQQSDNYYFLHAILLSRHAHSVRQSVPGLCLQEQSDLQVYCRNGMERTLNATRKHHSRRAQKWTRRLEFRWREPGPDGKRKHRRMVIGRIDQLVDESAARGRIAALHLDINFWDARLKGKPLTIAELAEHYRQRELKTRYRLEDLLHEADLRRLLDQMDLASLGKLPTHAHQRRRS